MPVPDSANWSLDAIRPLVPSAFCKLIVGTLGVLVTVQLMASPYAGVTLIGSVVMLLTLVGPVLEQLTAWLYCDIVEALPAAIASFKV